MDHNLTIEEDAAAHVQHLENILNVFTMYHKKWYNQSHETSIFDGVNLNEKNSTSLMMESFYSEMFKFQTAQHDVRLTTIYDSDDLSSEERDSFDELYFLKIDNELTKVSPRLFALVSYVATLNWTEMNWMIIPAKRQN